MCKNATFLTISMHMISYGFSQFDGLTAKSRCYDITVIITALGLKLHIGTMSLSFWVETWKIHLLPNGPPQNGFASMNTMLEDFNFSDSDKYFKIKLWHITIIQIRKTYYKQKGKYKYKRCDDQTQTENKHIYYLFIIGYF